MSRLATAPDAASLRERLPSAEVDELPPLRAGRAPLPRVAPADEAGLREALAFARAHELVVLPSGNGTKLDRFPCGRADLVLSTRRFAGVVDHVPGDGTLTARAGTAVAELARAARDGGHHLSPLVGADSTETLGGVIAAGRSGTDRLRHGPVRHNVLGARVLLADGRSSKSGGALVKNVTGYDLHRLWCGSRGRLCLVLEASLRLFPLPERTALLRATFADRGRALEASDALARRPVRPLAVLLHPEDARWHLEVALAGRPEVVRFEEDEVRAAARGAEPVAEGDEALRELVRRERAPGWPDLVLTAPPSRLEPALARLEELARGTGLEPSSVLSPWLAAAWTWTPGAEDETRARLAARAASELPALARLEARGLPAPSPPPGFARMVELARALDPTGLFAGGRFHGEL